MYINDLKYILHISSGPVSETFGSHIFRIEMGLGSVVVGSVSFNTPNTRAVET